MGRVHTVEDRDQLRVFRIEAPASFLEGVRPGDSIAVDGACLTPVRVEDGAFQVEAIGTTLGRTVVGGYESGSRVNLERAMQMGARLDGHLVQGHVDGVGQLLTVVAEGDFHRLRFQIPSEVHRGTLLHGSITLNGVSLTVNALEPEDRIEVGIIPHTWTHTNLSHLAPGDPVNVEGDLIGKYVGRWMERVAPGGSVPQPSPDAERKG
jgi:riboflavin synthase